MEARLAWAMAAGIPAETRRYHARPSSVATAAVMNGKGSEPVARSESGYSASACGGCGRSNQFALSWTAGDDNEGKQGDHGGGVDRKHDPRKFPDVFPIFGREPDAAMVAHRCLLELRMQAYCLAGNLSAALSVDPASVCHYVCRDGDGVPRNRPQGADDSYRANTAVGICPPQGGFSLP